MALYDGNHHLLLRVGWQDEHLVEIEARVIADGWSGSAAIYTTFDEIRRFASELARFDHSLSGEASLEAGREDGIGLVALRFYTTDAARHVACHVRLATSAPTGCRNEQVHKLTIEVTTEPSFIRGFIKGLERLAEAQVGEAMLIIE